jgi:hypothetical protein
MSAAPDRAYGSNVWAVWRRDLADRWHGKRTRANGRWGLLQPPPGTGKVIWVKAGASSESLLLAAEITRSIREKRLDVRLALTFERDDPSVWESRLRGLKKIGVGFGPCDLPRVVRRVLRRFTPLGVVSVDTVVAPHLSATLAAEGIHHAVVAANPPAVPLSIESVYPANSAQTQAWQSQPQVGAVKTGADLLTLLAEAQVDPNFKTAIGAAERGVWWMHGLDAAGAEALARAWRGSALSGRDLLFVSAVDPKLSAVLCTVFARHGAVLSLSAWTRAPIAPGTVVVVDEARWLPAVAVSSNAIHLVRSDRLAFWQALTGGCPLSLGQRGSLAYLNEPEPTLLITDDIAQVLQEWQAHADAPIAARKQGDGLRRLFWQERRRAAEVADAFLQQIYDW